MRWILAVCFALGFWRAAVPTESRAPQQLRRNNDETRRRVCATRLPVAFAVWELEI